MTTMQRVFEAIGDPTSLAKRAISLADQVDAVREELRAAFTASGDPDLERRGKEKYAFEGMRTGAFYLRELGGLLGGERRFEDVLHDAARGIEQIVRKSNLRGETVTLGSGVLFRAKIGTADEDLLEVRVNAEQSGKDGQRAISVRASCSQGKKRAAKFKDLRARKQERITSAELVGLFGEVLDGLLADARGKGIVIPGK